MIRLKLRVERVRWVRITYKILVKRLEGRRSFARPRRRW